jgi:hypothetical protein
MCRNKLSLALFPEMKWILMRTHAVLVQTGVSWNTPGNCAKLLLSSARTSQSQKSQSLVAARSGQTKRIAPNIYWLETKCCGLAIK